MFVWSGLHVLLMISNVLSVVCIFPEVIVPPSPFVISTAWSLFHFLPGITLNWADIEFYMLRWSDAWELGSLNHLRQKWQVAEDMYFHQKYKGLFISRFPCYSWIKQANCCKGTTCNAPKQKGVHPHKVDPIDRGAAEKDFRDWVQKYT
jgi:hypothetical protein